VNTPDVTVKVAFHGPSNAGNPYQIHVNGTFTAYWSYWYISVQATIPASENAVLLPISKQISYSCWTIGPHGNPHKHTCTTIVHSQVSWAQPEFGSPPASDTQVPTDVQEANFPVSATALVKVLFTTNGQGPN